MTRGAPHHVCVDVRERVSTLARDIGQSSRLARYPNVTGRYPPTMNVAICKRALMSTALKRWTSGRATFVIVAI